MRLLPAFHREGSEPLGPFSVPPGLAVAVLGTKGRHAGSRAF